jgi:magnesium transporter
MTRFIKKTSKKVGLPPGTIVHVGEKKTEKVIISLIDYDENHFQERTIEDIEEAFPLKDEATVTWINVSGVHEVDLIEKIGKHFENHPLKKEDTVNTAQRPKMEDFDHYVYVVMKMLYLDKEQDAVHSEQVSLILGPTFLMSFQEQPGDVFDALRERIRKGKGRIRKAGCDYLAYALMDALVDNYFVILEHFGEKMELLEEDLIENPTPEILESIHNMKQEMILLRKRIWPLREVVGSLTRGDSPLVRESTGVYLRDVYDHTIQVIDTIESFRDVLGGMLDIYLSTVSNKMNEVMKVLTIIATIFIPLTFLAGIYGMNFKYIPELEWRWGYFAAWGVMIATFVLLMFYFRRKKWL